MKLLTVAAVLLLLAVPASASPLFSGTDSLDYDVIGVQTYAIQGTGTLVLLIQARAVGTHDYVVTLRSLATATNKKLIAEVRFKDGQENGEPYASWLDACFVQDGSICNDRPAHAEKLTLAKLIEKIGTIFKHHPPAQTAQAGSGSTS
jgi:hypothetical protein